MSRSSRSRGSLLVFLPLIAFLSVVLLSLIICAVVLTNLPFGPADAQVTDPTTIPTSSTQGTDPTTQPTTSTIQPTESTGSTESTESTEPTKPPKEPVDLVQFFSESAFIGDSVTLALRNYCITNTVIGRPTFLCAGSYAVRHAIVDPDPGNQNIVSITYQNTAMRPEEALKASGVKRVFIMLGMNDIAFGVDYTMNNWKTLIRNIRNECPDMEIYIQSATPIHANNDKDGYKLNNANMDIYNQKLEAFCAENDCYFVSIAPLLKDENGDLANAYCSDPNSQGCHLTQAGVLVWIQALQDYVTNLDQ